MLDFSGVHILILLIVALVVVGPKDLPRLMRIVGQWLGKARAMADQFRKSFDDMARQSELDELRKEIENLRSERPLAGLEDDMHQSIVPNDMKSAAPVEIETAPPEVHIEPHVPEPAAEPVAADGFKPPAP
ncbi:MAG TPA: Sec-independent protein translocase protein TatB [Rhizomicrobium sp.]|nr:Sec-independent protein translocase protein TatB [Rhizomicrobium sp.]